MGTLIAIDAGTTGVRALAVTGSAQVIDVEYREIGQSYPFPGWVEHDADEIANKVIACVAALATRCAERGEQVDAIGITNQRETVVAWDRSDGSVLAPAPVWQDKRTAARCAALRDAGHLERVRQLTGLVLDPYFSATKMAWLVDHADVGRAKHLALGTIDSWLTWQLTGGADAGSFVTDPSNASRTLLYDLDQGRFSDELAELFEVPFDALAELRPSCGRFGVVRHAGLPMLAGVPISGILGDQQAALFGQACTSPGMVKTTYGTGAFVLVNAGDRRPATADGLLSTVAWDLGAKGGTAYALEGSAFVAGAAIQWLRDELGIIDSASGIESLARTAAISDTMRFVPAFVGLGSPFWDESARGAMVGITKGSGRAELARAVVESLSYEVRAITDAMAVAGLTLQEMRVDGGAAAMDLLLQNQADQSRVDVCRPSSIESTALGAATIAGLAEGIFGSLEELSMLWSETERFSPVLDAELAELSYAAWQDAVERSRRWI